MSFDLNMHTARLLQAEPFFAAISRRLDKKASTAVPTAGVRVSESGQFEMVYNPEFFAGLTDKERRGVIKHELYHLIFEHVTGRLPEGGMTKIWNYATDLAINSHLIGELPEGALIPGEGHFEDMPRGKNAEWYLAALKKKQEENPESEAGEGEAGESSEEQAEGNGSGSGGEQGEPGEGQGNGSGEPEPFDDHSGWGEGDSTANEIAKQRLKEVVKKAAEEASKAGNWGTVGSDTRREILDRLTAKVDWKKVLRYFIKTSQRANRSSTVKRVNRRYAYVHPGKKVNRMAKIAISIDQSGSVDDGMLARFFAELNKLANLAEFTVVPFDTRVDESKVYVWKKGETRRRERVMCGGTCFDAPTEYVNKQSFDGHIVLTDMEAPKPKASKCQRMWMTTERCARRPYFQTNERVIAITD